MPLSKSESQRNDFFTKNTAKRRESLGPKSKRLIKHPHDQAVAAALHTAHPKGGMADGGEVHVDKNEPGVQDATTSDFLAPFLLGPTAKLGAEGTLPALKGLGEAGEVSIGRAAPKMEEAAEAATPKIEPFIRGIQKSPNGNEA